MVSDTTKHVIQDKLNQRIIGGLKFEGIDYLCACQYIFEDTPDFLALYRQDPNIDFIYDNYLKLYFVNYYDYSHECVRRLLYESYTNNYSLSASEAADRYIIDGHGFFKSSVGHNIYIGQHYVLPTELNLALRRDIHRLP